MAEAREATDVAQDEDTGPDLASFLAHAAARVDAELDRRLPTVADCGDLAAAMRHLVTGGGKRFRPALVLLACRDVGGSEDDAIATAAAMELIHTYSLIHDDLPCMDDAKLRRGKACVHVAYPEATAVLAGDAMLTLAFEVIAAGTPAHRPIGGMIVALGRAAGWAGMAGGQVLDLAAEGAEPDLDMVRRIHEGKTASLIEVSLRLGAMAGGGGGEDVERLARYGHRVGLAFQIVDDLLDTEVSAEQMGKDVGADADNDKLTWPGVVGNEQARADARRLVDEALVDARGGREEALLAALAEKVLSRRN